MKDIRTLEDWRKLAGLRQGVINKLDTRVKRMEAEILTLRTSLESCAVRLAMYDQREAA